MVNNILIFRTDRIGDLIFTCPAIISIKKYFDDPKITLITSKKNHVYAKGLNFFNDIYEFPSQNILKKINFIYKLRKIKYDYIFVLDGKERSILATTFIKSKYKIAVTPKIPFYYNLLKIKFFIDSEDTNFYTIYENILSHCKINTKIENFNFLKEKKDNNFSQNIPIKNYLHIHLDEKWFINSYIKSYTDINPKYVDFTAFLNNISINRDILITTGIVDFGLLTELKTKYFKKKSDKIYFRNNSGNSIYLINKPSFADIESLLRNTRILITCQGSVTHAANSFDIKKIDIIEKNKVFFYQKFTSYLKNYYPIYRSNFTHLKTLILKTIKE